MDSEVHDTCPAILRFIMINISFPPPWRVCSGGITVVLTGSALGCAQSGVDRNRARNPRVYTPAASDRQPAAFQQWLRRHGGGGVPFVGGDGAVATEPPGAQSAAVPREQRLDRWGADVAGCLNSVIRRLTQGVPDTYAFGLHAPPILANERCV